MRAATEILALHAAEPQLARRTKARRWSAKPVRTKRGGRGVAPPTRVVASVAADAFVPVVVENPTTRGDDSLPNPVAQL